MVAPPSAAGLEQFVVVVIYSVCIPWDRVNSSRGHTPHAAITPRLIDPPR